jgi:hypothetical protein
LLLQIDEPAFLAAEAGVGDINLPPFSIEKVDTLVIVKLLVIY